ncbi:hypothetical protein AABB24_002669, partial [Solanum stoloniferum]
VEDKERERDMASRGGGWISSRSCINTSIPQRESSRRGSKGNHLSLITKRSKKPLVRISSSDGKWNGEWNCDYIFTLGDLQLEDLAEETETPLSIQLSIHKALGSQSMEQLSHLSPQNVATVLPHTAERFIQALKFGYYHQPETKDVQINFHCLVGMIHQLSMSNQDLKLTLIP